jgi:hypothetical protein
MSGLGDVRENISGQKMSREMKKIEGRQIGFIYFVALLNL